MPKKRASCKRKSGEGTRKPAVDILLRVPAGVRVETPQPGKTRNKISDPLEGFTLEDNRFELCRLFARQRREMKSSPGSVPGEFVRLWRRGLCLRAQLRRILKQPEVTLPNVELQRVVFLAAEAGMVWEQLNWKFGGTGGEVAKGTASRFKSKEGLTEANRVREAGLTEGLKHKLQLILRHEPDISRRDVADRLLEESEKDNRRCHDCQRSERLGDVGDETHCEHYRLDGKCRPCKECLSWYSYLAEWRSSRRTALKEEKKGQLQDDEIDERLLDALARRVGKVDSRPPGRRKRRVKRRGVVPG